MYKKTERQAFKGTFNMKYFLLLLFVHAAYGGTCTTISRTNNAANAVLTSTKYNLDNNTAYTAINAADGGCITDGTLEIGALNTSDFAAVLNGNSEGCKVTRSDASTVSISACRASVNGALLNTTIATTAAFGCTSCSAEATGTSYYVYIADGSTGTTLTPLLLTGAPNADGYDGSNNKVIGKIRNDSSGNLEIGNAGQWLKNRFVGFGSTVRVYDANGHGSTNTKITRFSVEAVNVGDDITYADTAAAGASFTVNSAGVYCVHHVLFNTSGGGTFMGISLNSSELTTNIQSLTADADFLAGSYAGNSEPTTASWCGFLDSGDILRPHTAGATNTAAKTSMTVSKVGVGE
jgi:hypothetical protein